MYVMYSIYKYITIYYTMLYIKLAGQVKLHTRPNRDAAMQP